MLDLLLSLLDDEGDDHTWDQGQSDRHDKAEIEGLTRSSSRLKDKEGWEGRSLHIECDVWVHVGQDRLVHVLGEVGNCLLRSCINKHVDLEVINVIRFGFVDLI